MMNKGPIPIRIYQEFVKRDWPELPVVAQDALASFLVDLQKNPDNPEVVTRAQRDSSGRLSLEFSPGYAVYWQIARDEFDTFGQPLRIEVLAILKTAVTFSEMGKGPVAAGDSPAADRRGLAERVYSRRTLLGDLAIWGTLHVRRGTREPIGWIVDSWSQGGPPFLNPKMHWVSLPDYKLHLMRLNVDFNSTLEIFPEDENIESERLVFVRATVKQWEREWLEEEAKRVS